ncbi:MAG: MoaD/ThiS family protein [Bacteroidetes bacterium]|nr:MoaD/ThiS family protein [Bacteroidota bacterium]MDA1333028.1 MoaD/ThiS family protein [Bacteroidota bacterium]
MTISVRVFAMLREALGASMIHVEVPENCSTRMLVDLLVKAFPSIEPVHNVIRVAVNDEWASWDTLIAAGDDVALLTPVSGG